MEKKETPKKNETLLFVDDEESILDIAREYFEHKGYRVITAENGLEALGVLKNTNIDCCFTDINMPRMNGIELAGRIWDMDNSIPVVIMTGFPSLDTTIRTLKHGVVDFLIKPVNLSQMELCVERVLRERRLFIDNVILKQELKQKEKLERLNRELNTKVREMNILNTIMRSFTTLTQSQDVFRRLVDMAVEITPADNAVFYVIDNAVKKPYQVASAAPGQGDGAAGMEQVVLSVAAQKTPLLISENTGEGSLADDIRSLLVVPLSIRDKIFGVLTASVTADGRKFTARELYYLSFMTSNAAYAIENLALYENIYANLFSTLFAFVKTIEAKDPYTEQHSNRVTGISMAIGRALDCTAEELDILNVAGQLHDIGKIGIRDEILLKPGRLTPEEFEVIKDHPVIGAEIVGQLGFWDREQEIIRHHHERFDGSGYPGGLKGEEIPLLARILSVADVFDAMASDRIYRKKMEEDKVLNIIDKGTGSQFDPEVVMVFHKLYKSGRIDDIY